MYYNCFINLKKCWKFSISYKKKDPGDSHPGETALLPSSHSSPHFSSRTNLPPPVPSPSCSAWPPPPAPPLSPCWPALSLVCMGPSGQCQQDDTKPPSWEASFSALPWAATPLVCIEVHLLTGWMPPVSRTNDGNIALTSKENVVVLVASAHRSLNISTAHYISSSLRHKDPISWSITSPRMVSISESMWE